jgi:hypothetical protein
MLNNIGIGTISILFFGVFWIINIITKPRKVIKTKHYTHIVDTEEKEIRVNGTTYKVMEV